MKTLEEYVYAGLTDTILDKNHRELGKILAVPNEYYQRDWISENTNIGEVYKRTSIDDPNESGYDLITATGLKIQSKYRSGSLHLETTRRNSKKNAGTASSTGHVKYSAGEADVYTFTIPKGITTKERNQNKDLFAEDLVNNSQILAIPEWELLDPKNLGYLVPRVPVALIKKYAGKAKETLEKAASDKK